MQTMHSPMTPWEILRRSVAVTVDENVASVSTNQRLQQSWYAAYRLVSHLLQDGNSLFPCHQALSLGQYHDIANEGFALRCVCIFSSRTVEDAAEFVALNDDNSCSSACYTVLEVTILTSHRPRFLKGLCYASPLTLKWGPQRSRHSVRIQKPGSKR